MLIESRALTALLTDKGQLNGGEHVALIFPHRIHLIAAFYACLYFHIVPAPIRPPHAPHICPKLN